MAEFKIVISTKDGKSYQREIKDAEAKDFLGKKVGEAVKGDKFGLNGYEMLITGGSDSSGFPMRKDVEGTGKKKVLAISGIGIKKKRKGQRQRKTVAGNTIHAGTAQINLKVTKEGKEKLGGEEAADASAEPEKKEEAKPKEKKAEEKKPEQTDKKEDKKEEKKPEEKTDKKEEKKEQAKPKEKKAEEKKPKSSEKKEEKKPEEKTDKKEEKKEQAKPSEEKPK